MRMRAAAPAVFAAVCLWAGGGCSQVDVREAAAAAVWDGPTYRPSIQPLGWTDGGDVLFVHTEERGGYDYRELVPCGGSGIYRTDGRSAPRPVLTGQSWCRGSTSPHIRPSLSADGRTVFVLQEHGFGDCTVVHALDLDARSWREAGRVCGSHVYGPAVSPDGGRIALDLGCGSVYGGGEPSRVSPRGCVDRDRERLTVMNLDGSAPRLVGAPADRDPVWSPDGLALAVRPTGRGDGDHVAVVDLRTGRRQPVTRGSGPAWSPDGQWLAFTRHRGRDGGRVTLHVIRTDGTSERLVFEQDPEDMRKGPQYPSPGGWPRDPLWSPDGRRIVFTKHFQTGNTLWIVNVDGTGLRQLSGRIESTN